MALEVKKLRRSSHDKVLLGLLGGLGEYLGIDPAVLRLAFIFVAVFTGVVPGILAYFIGSLVVPRMHPHHTREA